MKTREMKSREAISNVIGYSLKVTEEKAKWKIRLNNIFESGLCGIIQKAELVKHYENRRVALKAL